MEGGAIKRSWSVERDAHGHLHLIPRTSITRRSFTRRSGVHVPAKRMMSRGLHKQPVFPGKPSHILEPFRYHPKDAPATRRARLLKAVKEHGYKRVIRHLNELAILTRNSNPGVSESFRSDIEWLHRKYRPSSKGSRKVSKRSKKRASHKRKSKRRSRR